MDMGFVEVPDGRLFYETAGSGSPIVFIHPGLWDCRTWDDQFGVFAERYLVIRYDVRGYGRSSRPEPGQTYSHVRDLASVIDAVGVDRAALVACSMGGSIALDFTLTHPDLVAAQVLAAPGVGGFEGTPEEEAWWEDRLGPIGAAIESGDLERAQELRLEIWAPLGTGDPAGTRIREIAFDNIHEMTMDESGAEELDPPTFTRLEQVSIPTFVIEAVHDPSEGRRLCEILAARIPGARHEKVDADHVVNMRIPDEFNRLVLEFLAVAGWG